MHIRTIAVILAFIVVALLIINKSLRSEWLWLISLAVLGMAFIVYFFPQFKKWHASR